MSVSFDLFVTYSQVAVFDHDLQDPFNDWQSEHVAQGFSWRPGSVSFGTLDDSGTLLVEVVQTDKASLRNDTKRAILVPFRVAETELVEIASIDTGRIVKIPRGNYALTFETGYTDSDVMWARFTFVLDDTVQPNILITDSSLSPVFPLLMNAHSA